jgi:hypothetical protein
MAETAKAKMIDFNALFMSFEFSIFKTKQWGSAPGIPSRSFVFSTPYELQLGLGYRKPDFEAS